VVHIASNFAAISVWRFRRFESYRSSTGFKTGCRPSTAASSTEPRVKRNAMPRSTEATLWFLGESAAMTEPTDVDSDVNCSTRRALPARRALTENSVVFGCVAASRGISNDAGLARCVQVHDTVSRGLRQVPRNCQPRTIETSVLTRFGLSSSHSRTRQSTAGQLCVH